MSADIFLRGIEPRQLVDDVASKVSTDVVAMLRPMLIEANEPRLVDRKELARSLGISESSVSRLVANGRIPSVSLGQLRRFVIADVIRSLSKSTGEVSHA